MSWIDHLLHTRTGRHALMNWIGLSTVAIGFIVSAISISKGSTHA